MHTIIYNETEQYLSIDQIHTVKPTERLGVHRFSCYLWPCWALGAANDDAVLMVLVGVWSQPLDCRYAMDRMG